MYVSFDSIKYNFYQTSKYYAEDCIESHVPTWVKERLSGRIDVCQQ